MSASPRIGDPVNRVDGEAKVTGSARYAADHFPPGLLYGWIVGSPLARGRVTGIDEAAARAVPGVVEVISHRNRRQLPRCDRSYEDEAAASGSPFRPLYDDEVLFSGQPVALVVAQTLEAARDAASLLQVGYESASHDTDFERAMAEPFPPKSPREVEPGPRHRGNPDQALAHSPVRHAATYRHPAQHHNPMEMHAATVVWEPGDRLTVYDKTQGTQNVQSYLARIFGLDEDDVRVRSEFVGGAFGSGLRPQYHVFLAALAAIMLQRSVRVGMTRQQMFTHVYRPPAVQSVALGAGADGSLNAIINDATHTTSRFERYTQTIVDWALMHYKCPNARGTYRLASVDTCTPGDMRAPGAATGVNLFEIAMDELAYAAKVDPVHLRRVNHTDKDAMHGRPFTSKALREALQAGAERFGWAARSAPPRSMREGTELVGWGMATGVWEAPFEQTAARARLAADGTLEVACAMTDIGTGTATVMAQVAGDTLGVPLDRIRVRLGDSDLPEAPVEGGSCGAASAGAAVHLACLTVGAQLHQVAAGMAPSPIGDAAFDDVVFGAGHMMVGTGPARRVSLVDLVRASGREWIEAEQVARPDPGESADKGSKAKNTHSAVFVEVRIDEELPIVRVTRVVIAVAAGRIINPKTARSQVIGGAVMAIGMALHEETVMDHRFGRFMTHNFADYHIPVNADIPEIDVIFVNEPDADVSPLGVKGVGEIGVVGTAAAVVNAIYHATGRRVRSLPVTVDKLI
ncbi:xanthine dehydrogenase family protein molybdopterin-binding subunit [Telluria mixta]|uniref:Xanthine dehydrogenase family protein molybdopterin-binding subunit n=1 Tax=Telluria mixta TaxID=34071 RepID=A0ABT2C6F3_9BURK|nr:xanthine dehydrogenase family protein molybdopterin-binding subunit [Telluria mixta]MCS0632224.1 xanthine dehydrogenase family protein molybdopterin-binding subunit [Telluria mixta]WEM95014.1 xanthine dehydrogenase family protein molybdopterin-binding subunit [Telluria mixta]